LSWILPALLLLPFATAAIPAPSDPDEAQQAYAAGHYDVARQLWTAQAEAGDPAAQLGLGSLYDLGQGVPRNPAVAYGWYRRAAAAGSPAAEFNVAAMRDTGDGVPRDAAEAALWYGRAAAHGNRRAQYNLGQLYAAGDGVPRNPEQAEAWFRAAAADLPAAAERLAGMRRAGGGTRPRPPAPADAARPLEAAQPVAPANGDVIPTLAGAPGVAGTVELVWISPAQPVPVRFFVQLMALDPVEPHEVFATYLDETATLATLDRVPGRYAWRVYAVGRNLGHYAPSEWNQFQVRPPG
jgi:hypothetical protein